MTPHLQTRLSCARAAMLHPATSKARLAMSSKMGSGRSLLTGAASIWRAARVLRMLQGCRTRGSETRLSAVAARLVKEFAGRCDGGRLRSSSVLHV